MTEPNDSEREASRAWWGEAKPDYDPYCTACAAEHYAHGLAARREEVERLTRERDEARDRVKQWRNSYEAECARGEETLHALCVVGFPSHADLNACGCAMCGQIRTSMIEAGFLERGEGEP